MQDVEEASAELSAAIGAQNFAFGQLLLSLTNTGTVNRFEFLALLPDRAEAGDVSDLQRNSLHDLVESIRETDDPYFPPSRRLPDGGQVISMVGRLPVR